MAFIRSWRMAGFLPSRNMLAWRMSCWYSSGVMYSTHGAVHRLIWYCRHGLVRFLKKLSLQFLMRKIFCNTLRLSLTAPELGNGPNQVPPPFFVRPRRNVNEG